jgi:hypothetical protein
MLPPLPINGSEFRPDTIEQRVRREQMRVPAAVAFQDVELFSRAVFVVAAERPGAGAFGSVSRGGVEGSLRDSEVEVAED